ncbi:MAG TPA: aspartyl protease family protein [Steroidobacteraceae bacterium]
MGLFSPLVFGAEDIGASIPVSAPASVLPSPQPDSAQAIDDSVFALPTTRDHIGRVLVPVTINGRGPFRFIVDTGANHSTISPRTAQMLGLIPTQETPFHVDGITGDTQAAYVKVTTLQTGDLIIDDTSLPVVWAPVMAGADGILGAAGLTEKSLLIDFQRNRVEIAHHIAAADREDAVKIHALRLTHGLITLDITVGGVRTCAIIDTGAERTLGNLALRDALRTKPSDGRLAMVTSVFGATREVERGELRYAPTLVLDGLRISEAEIVYGNFHIFKVWKMDQKPALIIGMDVLGTVASLGIDFKTQDVYVTSVRKSPNSMGMTPGELHNMAIRR